MEHRLVLITPSVAMVSAVVYLHFSLGVVVHHFHYACFNALHLFYGGWGVLLMKDLSSVVMLQTPIFNMYVHITYSAKV